MSERGVNRCKATTSAVCWLSARGPEMRCSAANNAFPTHHCQSLCANVTNRSSGTWRSRGSLPYQSAHSWTFSRCPLHLVGTVLVLLVSFLCVAQVSGQCHNRSDFVCRLDNGTCIPRSKWQDGEPDCADGSDEECLEWQFDCKFGKPRCVNNYNLLDGRIDCSSGFDEACPAHYFVCMDRSDCIDPQKYQDGAEDCRDGSDEQCAAGHFHCRDQSQCIAKELFQNGQPDCPDASDEDCTLFQFQCLCGWPRCIDLAKYNDSHTDCSEGSDEPRLAPAVASPDFVCDDGKAPRSRNSAFPPPRPPVLPCEGTDAAKCSKELGEVCLLIAAAPRCVCPADTIREHGTGKCVKCIEPLTHTTSIRTTSSVTKSTEISTTGSLSVVTTTTGSETTASTILLTTQAPETTTTDAVTTTFLPISKKIEQKPTAAAQLNECDPQLVNTCPRSNEQCRLLGLIFTCLCVEGYQRDTFTGVCQPDQPSTSVPQHDATTLRPGQCLPKDAEGCSGANEHCEMVDGFVGCLCNEGFVRRTDNGLCIVAVNECTDPNQNDCDPNAICMDNPLGYECLCKSGYIDMSDIPQTTPGRKCLPLINECNDPTLNDCDREGADCLDLPGNYTCHCKSGYKDVSVNAARFPGRRCVRDINHCLTSTECDQHATCTNTVEGYLCRCNSGYVDVSPIPDKAGRICKEIINECLNETANDCDKKFAECIDLVDSYTCRCVGNLVDLNAANPGRRCQPPMNPCAETSLNDCDQNAVCQPIGELGDFTCQCNNGYFDKSPRKAKPGRACILIVDECAEKGTRTTCDQVAECNDTIDGYTCKCPAGYRDVSPDPANSPGRQCVREATECPRAQVDCDANASCMWFGGTFECRCPEGWLDTSSNPLTKPGRSCSQTGQGICASDCHAAARCITSSNGASSCACPEGYRDDSPDRNNKPGRVCVQITEIVIECNVNDPNSCDQSLFEVCTFMSPGYRCSCPPGVSRLPDKRCRVIDECAESRLNNCDLNALCIDTADSYQCQCKAGYADISKDQPGRQCVRTKDECQAGEHDCGAHAACQDTPSAFTCNCDPGYADISYLYNQLPGRRCVKAIDECSDANLNDCAPDAVCEDSSESYVCRCKEGFLDVSPNITSYPGRRCTPRPIVPLPDKVSTPSPSTDSCTPTNANTCPSGEVCRPNPSGHFVCQCPVNSQRFDDGTCKVFSACSDRSLHDCDQNAICSDVFNGYTCQCKPGFVDRSSDPNTSPGRVCRALENECANEKSHDCSPFAHCVDTRDGYDCVCSAGYVDVSSEFNQMPGRRCYNASNECGLRSLNTCDENADCIDKPGGYVCVCPQGFIDWSYAANLQPGRICTVQTVCNYFVADLIFLVDGSGSIGTVSFYGDVLRFLREFVDLFDIGQGPNSTRVGVIQYSDQIRQEFALKDYNSKQDVQAAMSRITYLTGLTQTGKAIHNMATAGFSTNNGARNRPEVFKVGIVITDGRSQDNVTGSSLAARQSGIRLFAVGVTDHVLESELEQIAGSKSRYFLVKNYTDLNTRLRGLIQKEACKEGPAPPVTPRPGTCATNRDCDGALNQGCLNGICSCFAEFPFNPATHECGGIRCNPNITTSCPSPEFCDRTPYGDHRCRCPLGYIRTNTGACRDSNATPAPIPGDCRNNVGICRQEFNEKCIIDVQGIGVCDCEPPNVRNPRNNVCGPDANGCNPNLPNQCDDRKKEQCLRSATGSFVCQCPPNFRRDAATGNCQIDECAVGLADCDPNAWCNDTFDGFVCRCPPDYLDVSLDRVNKPGRICSLKIDECKIGKHNCSINATCINTEEAFLCSCKAGYFDASPNKNVFPGIKCMPIIDECKDQSLNDCSKNAVCIDTQESYVCICKPGFEDKDPFNRPGRVCEQKVVPNTRCNPGNNDCDRNAQCQPRGEDQYDCVCPSNYVDRSPPPLRGRICIRKQHACEQPETNDCDKIGAICQDLDEGFTCRCKPDYFDSSPEPVRLPGRVCKPLINECERGIDDCDRINGNCTDTPEAYECHCAPGTTDFSLFTRPGRDCRRTENECLTGKADCSPAPSAVCIDTQDSFLCQCNEGYFDNSPEPISRPGRVCRKLVNECLDPSLNDCHKEGAVCFDTQLSFRCQCKPEYDDANPSNPGRVCVLKNPNECLLGTANCHANAECFDLPRGFGCRCLFGFLDQSPDPSQPGRVCVPHTTPVPQTTPPPECLLGDANACKPALREICQLVNGKAACVCPENFQRNPNTNACTVINECLFFFLNDCSFNADCRDELDGYTCTCRPGFIDKSRNRVALPGRICDQSRNECALVELNDCDREGAICEDLDDGYTCRCKQPDFIDVAPQRPGRNCRRKVDECRGLHTCDPIARCIDLDIGYRCECPEGTIDITTSLGETGRQCRIKINECLNATLNDCDKQGATCEDTVDSFRCQCLPDFLDVSPNPAFPGRHCRKREDECQTGRNDCHVNAICKDTEEAYTCTCSPGYLDLSPDKSTRPGRFCFKLENECLLGTHDCDPKATCRDLDIGFTCECPPGLIDRSSNLPQRPGRVCQLEARCPPTTDCHRDALCIPEDNGGYSCRCLPGYVDFSPAGKNGIVCERENECKSGANDCSQFANCTDLPTGYRCECLAGYDDRSPDPSRAPGRFCEPVTPPPPPRNPCMQNDCHRFARCRSTSQTTFTCECLPGYRDLDQSNPGKNCEPESIVCAPNRNDCHRYALCTPTANGYTCKCKDGWRDKNPSRPGRECEELQNECLDASQNDCDILCDDLDDGYTCHCPQKYKDISPDPQKPGRKCKPLVNECINPQLNDCSRFANCNDTEDAYTCTCREGYLDNNAQSNDPKVLGRDCYRKFNECESNQLNDCHLHALCKDKLAGYDCECPAPFEDHSPDKTKLGRLCLYDECSNPRTFVCDGNATCQDTPDSYVCHCKEGFDDVSTDPVTNPGKKCAPITSTLPTPRQTSTPRGIPCGQYFCDTSVGLRCIGGARCECPSGQAWSSAQVRCVDAIPFDFPIIVARRNEDTLYWSVDYGNKGSSRYLEITDLFNQGVRTTYGSSNLGQKYVGTDVLEILNPRTQNQTLTSGLWFNIRVWMTPDMQGQDKQCRQTLIDTIISRYNYSVGGTALYINQYQPVWPPEVGNLCGGVICQTALGEVCIAGSRCDCQAGFGRDKSSDECVPLDSFRMYLIVVREGIIPLTYNSSFLNPSDLIYQRIVPKFVNGMDWIYGNSSLKPYYVSTEINELRNPSTLNNNTLTNGVLFAFTCNFRAGVITNRGELWNVLWRAILSLNYSVGGTDLFVNPFQYNPFGYCLNHDCSRDGLCNEQRAGFTCQCPANWTDRDPQRPGRFCLPIYGYNECLRKEDNDCSRFSECIDLERLFTCKCLPGYEDQNRNNPGRDCKASVCLGLNEGCGPNMTCAEQNGNAICVCQDGYVDVRSVGVNRLLELNLSRVNCLPINGTNECQLGLTDCAAIALCKDLPIGYSCECPAGFIDAGPPDNRGRLCQAPLCGQCGNHGSCETDPDTKQLVCKCEKWYRGDRCQQDVRMILLIIFAIIFFLLGLCCLLFFCLRCRCFKEGGALWYREALFPYRRGWWHTLAGESSGSESGEFSGGSGYYPDMTIPRAKLKGEGGVVASSRTGSREIEERKLTSYLEEDRGVIIPRARLQGGSRSTIEREGSESVVFSDVHAGLPAGRSYRTGSYESETESSSGSSEYLTREEIERRIISETKITETRADILNNATAEFHVYPPIAEEAAHELQAYEAAGPSKMFEQDYSQSVATMSVAGHYADTASVAYSQPRGMSEYTERDDDMTDTGSQASSETSHAGQGDVYDKKTLVRRSHQYQPDASGRGGTEKFKTEETSTVKSVQYIG